MVFVVVVVGFCFGVSFGQVFSYWEVLFIIEIFKVDGIDFYMFKSYEFNC